MCGKLKATETGLSAASIHRIWQTFGLQPHRGRDVQAFDGSADSLRRYEDQSLAAVSGAAADAPSCCALMKNLKFRPWIRILPIFPMRPGVPERQTHDYNRHGVTSLFAALDVATGKIVGACHRRHRHQEFLRLRRDRRRSPQRTVGSSSLSSTTTGRTRHRRCVAGSLPILVSNCTLRRPTWPAGSIRLSASLPEITRRANFGAEHLRVLRPWNGQSSSISVLTTAKPNPSSGRRRPTRSSTKSFTVHSRNSTEPLH